MSDTKTRTQFEAFLDPNKVWPGLTRAHVLGLIELNARRLKLESERK